MSLLGKIAALLGGGSASKACVVDGDRLAGGDRVGPGERFQALNRLARYATREELSVKVVFGGRPLREAGEGETFNGVQVFYGDSAEEVRNRLVSLARGSAVLVTSDQALEQDMRARGKSTMRMSTLRKAMETSTSEGGGRENGGGELRQGGRDRDGGRRGRHRGGRGRGDRRGEQGPPRDQQGQGPVPAEGAPSSSPAPEANSRPASGGTDNSVKNLIDLVE